MRFSLSYDDKCADKLKYRRAQVVLCAGLHSLSAARPSGFSGHPFIFLARTKKPAVKQAGLSVFTDFNSHFGNPSIHWKRTGGFASAGYPGIAFSMVLTDQMMYTFFRQLSCLGSFVNNNV
jgi:hypothetical protein